MDMELLSIEKKEFTPKFNRTEKERTKHTEKEHEIQIE